MMLLRLLPFTFGLTTALFLTPVASAQDAVPIPMPTTATPTPGPATAPTANSRYHLAATWKIPDESGWDYLTVDPGAHRLYLARQDRVQVLNTDSGELVGEVKGLDGAHGIALAPRLGRGFATSGNHNTVVVFDLKSLKPIGDPIPVGTKPDAIVYVPGKDKVFVLNSGSNDTTILEAKDGTVDSTLPLGGKPEFAVAEGAGRVFVNLEDKNEVVEIDLETLAVENRYPLKQGHAPTGLSLDPDGGRLFVGCGNEKMVVMATEDGTIMGTLPIGKGVDATAFDNRTKLAFAANGTDGTVTVVDAYKANPKVVETFPTQRSARTLAVDGRTHDLFLPAAEFESNPEPGQLPKMVPDTFVILKFAYDGSRR